MRAINRFTQSSSFFVGVLFTGLLALGIYFVAYVVVMAQGGTLTKETEAALRSEAKLYKALHQLGGFEQVQQALSTQLDSAERGYFYALQNRDDQLLLANIPQWPVKPMQDRQEFFTFEIDHARLQGVSQSVRPMSEHFDLMAVIVSFPDGAQLLIGRNVDDIEIAQWVSGTFGWLMISILAAISIISIWIGHYVVSRINRIADTASHIMETGNLSERIPIDSDWDDLSKLSLVLNHMLSELEQRLADVKAVSDNIAHDLRTPLTRLRGHLEMLRSAEDKYELLHEVDNILSIFNGLLRIADVESEKQKAAFKQVGAKVILEDVTELYGAHAEAKDIQIECRLANARLVADRDLLFQAFANVLDNAIKFTPEGGTVTISMTVKNNLLKVDICDSGPGIAEQHREQVTKRFYRVESSRSRPGNGLGLALVAAIVELHGGNLAFHSNKACAGGTTTSGLCVSINLPIHKT